MPAFQVTPRFERDRKQLTSESRARFQRVVTGQFAPGLAPGVSRAGLRATGVQAAPGLFEMTGRRTAAPQSPTGPGNKPANRTSSGAGSALTTSSREP